MNRLHISIHFPGTSTSICDSLSHSKSSRWTLLAGWTHLAHKLVLSFFILRSPLAVVPKLGSAVPHGTTKGQETAEACNLQITIVDF